MYNKQMVNKLMALFTRLCVSEALSNDGSFDGASVWFAITAGEKLVLLPPHQHKQPVTQDKQPVTQDKQPVTQDKQPVTQEKQPVTQEPVTQEKQPVTQKKQPVTQEKQPVTQDKQPVTQDKTTQHKTTGYHLRCHSLADALRVHQFWVVLQFAVLAKEVAIAEHGPAIRTAPRTAPATQGGSPQYQPSYCKGCCA